MGNVLLFGSGVIAGVVGVFAAIYVKAYMIVRHNRILPIGGQNVVFADDGFAYWRNENGFYRAPIVNEMPDFNNLVELDAMEVPAEELHKLLQIMSHLE